MAADIPEEASVFYLLARGKELAEHKRYAEALEVYKQAIARDPSHDRAWLGQGWALQKLGRSNEALAAINRVLELKQDDVDGLRCKAGIMFTLGDPVETLRIIEKLAEIVAPDAYLWNLQGQCFHILQRYNEALTAYSQSLALQPDQMQSLKYAANILHFQRRLREALPLYERLITITPLDFAARINYYYILARLWRLRRAFRVQQQMYQLADQSLQTRLELKYAQLNQALNNGQYRIAILISRMILQHIDPTNIPALQGKAQALRGLKRFSEAEAIEARMRQQDGESC